MYVQFIIVILVLHSFTKVSWFSKRYNDWHSIYLMLKQNNIPKLTTMVSANYRKKQKCNKRALIKIFIHTFLRYTYSFLHILHHCAFILQRRCKYKKQNSFLTHNSEVSTSPWAEVSRFFLRRRTVRPSDRSQSTDRTQLRALCCCSTSVTAPSATWVNLWYFRSP